MTNVAVRLRRTRPSAYRKTTDPARSPVHYHQPTRTWRGLRLLIAGSKDHAFLDRAWVPWLLRLCPKPMRDGLALRLLSLSPHYWIYQWTNKYPPGYDRCRILECEYERNADSRKEICRKLLTRYVRADMTVLDFGCGPGFLARQVSGHVSRIVATDVSRGVLACAEQLNPAANLSYVSNGLSKLHNVTDASMDLVYSFAVFQHLRKRQTSAFFNEFARVLKPGGMGVCHTILKEPEHAREYDPAGFVGRRTMLRMVYYSAEEVEELLTQAGLTDVRIDNISDLADIDDDIGSEQLVTFRRPAA